MSSNIKIKHIVKEDINNIKQNKTVEEQKIAKEKRIAEETRIAKEKKLAEEKRIARDRRIAEEKRIAREKKIVSQVQSQLISFNKNLSIFIVQVLYFIHSHLTTYYTFSFI